MDPKLYSLEARGDHQQLQTARATEPPPQRPGQEVHLDEWVAPDIADERGYLRAGKVLEWMDVVGVLAATRHCGRPVVTASVDGMELATPVRVGDRATMTAQVAHTSERSVGVAISMRHGVDAYMTFVALDETGRATRVPQFLPQTPAEQTRFREGALRREFRKKLAAGELGPLLPADAQAAGGAGGAGSVGADVDARLLLREWLKTLPRLMLPWERESRESQKPRTRHLSYIHKIEPIRVGALNFHGTLYGGTLMRWLESAASLSARAYNGGAAVRLASLDGLTFIRPAPRDLFVHIRSVVVHAAAPVVTVLVNVSAEDPVAGAHVEILRAFLSYVPLDEQTRVLPLDCSGEEELLLFEEVEQRRALQRQLAAARAA
jgi:acyl-CoA hydrolase